jgi:hypothetical protein
MATLAQVKTDVDAVIADIGSTTAYASITPANVNTDSPSGLQQSLINCHQLLVAPAPRCRPRAALAAGQAQGVTNGAARPLLSLPEALRGQQGPFYRTDSSGGRAGAPIAQRESRGRTPRSQVRTLLGACAELAQRQ